MSVQRTRGGIMVRPYAGSDVASLYLAVRGSIDSLSRWMPWCHDGYSLHDAQQWVDHCQAAWSAHAEFPLGIFDAAGAVVGGTGLSQVNRACNTANLGYWVSEPHHGNGIASTAARLAAQIGFQDLGFTRLEIVVLADNVASHHVARKLGATLEGQARNRLVSNAGPATALVYWLVPQDLVDG